MTPDVAHPRALALFRFLLYGAGVVLAGAIVVATVGFLFVVGILATLLAVVAGDPVTLPFLLLLAAAVLCGTTLVGATVLGARRLDRLVTRADRVPTPVETVRRRYVEGKLDEGGLERGLEAALADESPSRPGPRAAARNVESGSTGRHVDREPLVR